MYRTHSETSVEIALLGAGIRAGRAGDGQVSSQGLFAGGKKNVLKLILVLMPRSINSPKAVESNTSNE